MNMNKLKIYLVAGEPSGDALGARFMKAMMKKTSGNVEFYGVGGESMEHQGLKSLFDISDLAIMGMVEIIPSIPKVLRLLKQTVDDIEKIKPDVIMTIDSWGFGSRVQKMVRKKHLNIPQVHYVAPQVWAWKKKRAKTMYKYVDYLMTLFPQEPKYFTPYHLDARFIGHPVIESGVVQGNSDKFREKYKIAKDREIIAILPGSRHNEVSRLLPIFLETAKHLYKENTDRCFVLPTVKTVAERVKNMIKNTDLPIIMVETEEDRHNAFNASQVAIAASGTVALELAIANIPHIIAYKVSPFSAMLARKFLHIQFVNLSNILLGREVVPELLQESCVCGNIERNIKELLSKGDLYEKQMEGFAKVRRLLGFGEQMPSEKACDFVLDIIKQNKI